MLITYFDIHAEGYNNLLKNKKIRMEKSMML